MADHSAGVARPPNLFQLSGAGLHLSYSSSGIDGRPSLQFQDPTRLLSFAGADIRVVEGDLGSTVSVSIERSVDTGYTSFTVLVPTVELPGGAPAAISTVGITTLHRTSLLPATGQLDSYHVVHLHGTALHVEP